jgi:hypothetical protein
VGTWNLKQRMQAVLFKMSSTLVWTVCLVVAHTMADLSEASAGFTVSPTRVTLAAVENQAPFSFQVVTTNTGNTTVTLTWDDSVNWFKSIVPASSTMTLAAGQTGTWTMTVDIQRPWSCSPACPMKSGTYEGNFRLSSGGQVVTVPVTLALTTSTTNPTIGLSPTSLAFNGSVGGTNPAAQTISIANKGGGTLTWSASENVTWLTLSPQTGTNAGVINVSVNLSGVAAGTYIGAVTVSGVGAGTKSVPVTLTVTASTATPAIGLSPGSLSFSGTVGGMNPAAQTISIANSGGGTLGWSASEHTGWMTLSPRSGTNAGTINVNVNLSGLAAGTYTRSVTISGTDAIAKTVPVTLTVTSGTTTPVIGLSPTSLAFTGSVGGANPAAQTVNIANTGGGTLTWSASEDASWLTVSPASGSGTGIATATVNPANLTAGTYNATITVAATGATAKSVPVTLTVTSGTTTPAIGLNPISLSFTASAGGANPAAQTISIANTGGGTLSWSASDNAPWLTISPASGSGTGTATVAVNTAGLAAGSLNATITVAATGATTKSVPVTLTVTAPSTSAATLSWNASTSSDTVGYKVYKGTASGSYGAPLATLQGPVLSYQATGLLMNTTYFFVVTSYDAAGNESLHSNEVSKSIF